MKINRFVAALIIATFSSTPGFAGVTMEDAFSPHQGATELVVKTIESAKKSVRVAAYSFTSKPIVDALVSAHDRGIDVEIVLDKSQENGRMTRYVVDHKIPTRINYQYSIMHDKFMIVDENAVELGSFNYTAAAENKNAENVFVVRNDAKVIKDYTQQWHKLWDEGE
jgi:phosphatidylserine/phosphatidylglycerophosphate/cardiolipin synthase-like enzyme